MSRELDTAMRAPRGAVVFDCDGTLVDTRRAWDRAYTALYADYGRNMRPSELDGLVGLALEPLGRALANLLGQPERHADLAAYMFRNVTENSGQPIRLIAGARRLMLAVRATRPVAVASNSPRSIVLAYLDAVGLAREVDVVIGCDDVLNPKPGPDVYLRACEMIGVPPHSAVAIEDCPVGVAAARAAGLFVIRHTGVYDTPSADLVCDGLGAPVLWRALGLTNA